MTKGVKIGRDPVSWTRYRCPRLASKAEIMVLLNRSLSFINTLIKAGDLETVRVGRRLDVIVDSAFDYQDHLIAASRDPNNPPPAPPAGPGRPRKPPPPDPENEKTAER
jgi:hypothetical protein